MAEDKVKAASGLSDDAVIAEAVDGDNVVSLKKPLENGTTKLVFDFDRINGYTLIKCEKYAKKEDPAITVLALSQIYQAHVAAAACHVRYDEILGLSAADFTAVTLKAQAFLLNSAAK